MNTKKQRVTIVGAGHYGRNLISRVYASLPNVLLRAVISPHTPGENLRGTLLESLPLLRTAALWRERFGVPGPSDVFDLCIHHPIIPALLEGFTKIGARLFILPKPVALSEENWRKILKIKTGFIYIQTSPYT